MHNFRLIEHVQSAAEMHQSIFKRLPNNHFPGGKLETKQNESTFSSFLLVSFAGCKCWIC